jgi:zinc transport system substrate-binding protein
VVASAVLAVASAVGACASDRASSPGGLRVVASFYPLAEAARRVGGPGVHVTDLTPPGVEPHDLELKASQVADIQDAAVVLVLGKGFQPAVEKVAAGRKGTVEVLARLPTGDGRSSDPHVWLDPVLKAGIVDQVAAALAAADAPRSGTYEADAATFKTELAALDGRYRSGLADCRRRDIVTSHEAFGHLAARYGLRQEAVAGLSPDVEPDPARLAQLTDLVRARGVTTVFTESLVSPRVAQTLAREAGVGTDVLDPLEGVGRAEAARGANYITVMDENLARLRAALGCT